LSLDQPYGGLDWIMDTIEFFREGDLSALKRLEDRERYNSNSFYLKYLIQKLSGLCDKLPDSLILLRLHEYLESEKASEALASLLDRDFSSLKYDREITENTTKSSSQLLFWTAIITLNKHIHHGAAQCPVLDGVRRAWAYQAITDDPTHLARQRRLLTHGFDQPTLDSAYQQLWSQITRWLPKQDVKFYDAVMAKTSVLDEMEAGIFLKFAARYSMDLRSKNARPSVINRNIDLYTEGVVRDFFGATANQSNLTYGWFLASDKPITYPAVAENIENSFRRMAKAPAHQLPGVLHDLSFYTFRERVLPMFEALPGFAKALGKIDPSEASKLIEKSSMRNRWLNHYPELCEDVFIRDLGL
jgi:hypothetical protein